MGIFPHFPVKAAGAAMKMIFPVVAGKRKFLPIQGKATARDPVGVTPDRRAEVSVIFRVFLKRS
jgi:hypothetical protein